MYKVKNITVRNLGGNTVSYKDDFGTENFISDNFKYGKVERIEDTFNGKIITIGTVENGKFKPDNDDTNT